VQVYQEVGDVWKEQAGMTAWGPGVTLGTWLVIPYVCARMNVKLIFLFLLIETVPSLPFINKEKNLHGTCKRQPLLAVALWTGTPQCPSCVIRSWNHQQGSDYL
jgi:hypothetical protein